MLGRGGPLLRGADPAVSGRRGRLAFAEQENAVQIWRTPLGGQHQATGDPEPLLASSGIDVFPDYSPDGTAIAFQSERDGQSHIWISDAEGKNARRLSSVAADGSPKWSPDGGAIAFDSTRDGAFSVFLMPVQGGRPVLLASPGHSPSWSPNGEWVYYAAPIDGDIQIWRVRPDGSGRQQITTGGAGRPRPGKGDGHLYYFRGRDGVWRVPLAGGKEESVLAALTDNDSFQPAEGGIYYAELLRRTRQARLMFWDLSTHEAHPIGVTVPAQSRRQSGIGLAISPDESWLLFHQWEPMQSDLMLAEGFE